MISKLMGSVCPSVFIHASLGRDLALPCSPCATVSPSLLRVPVTRELLDVVHQAIQVPLCVHLGLPPQGEAVELLVMPQVGKHRLHGGHALAVYLSASWAVDGLLHALGELVRRGLVPGKERHLPHRGAIRVAQTLAPEVARPTAPLGARELVTASPVGHAVAAIAVEVLACRADAGIGDCIHPEVFGSKQFRGLVRRALVGQRIG